MSGISPTHADILKSITDLLKWAGYYYWKHWGGPMGKKGISDIIAIQPGTGRICAIEVKAKGDKPSAHQTQFLEDVTWAGGIAILAYDVETVIKELGLEDRFLL